MITLEAEFRTKTFAGFADCNVHKYVFDNPRDIDKAEDAIKWVKTVLTKGSDAMVTFGYFDDRTYNQSRLIKTFHNEKECIEEIIWDNRGNCIEQVYHEKLTTALVRRLYLETVSALTEHEWKKAHSDDGGIR